MTKAERERHRQIRLQVSRLIASAGCSCCRDREIDDAMAWVEGNSESEPS